MCPSYRLKWSRWAIFLRRLYRTLSILILVADIIWKFPIHRSSRFLSTFSYSGFCVRKQGVSWATGLCKDYIKHNKGESRYSTRLMVLIKSASTARYRHSQPLDVPDLLKLLTPGCSQPLGDRGPWEFAASGCSRFLGDRGPWEFAAPGCSRPLGVRGSLVLRPLGVREIAARRRSRPLGDRGPREFGLSHYLIFMAHCACQKGRKPESYNIHVTPELSKPGCHMEPFYAFVPNKDTTELKVPSLGAAIPHESLHVWPGCSYRVTIESNPHDGRSSASVVYTVPDCVEDVCSCAHARRLPRPHVRVSVSVADTINITWFLLDRDQHQEFNISAFIVG
ncbi:hypothetical protein J6590_075860 [Homalodisca vitripennis]|nr:hypothetical protein J6590_075860 [Homalodisca vitripennis]